MKLNVLKSLIVAILWSLISFSNALSQGTWTDILFTGDDPIARTECSFIQAGDHFYLVGGRGGNKRVMEFDYTDSTWTERANMPSNTHHFQAVELDGLIYVVGAFGGNYPNEFPRSEIYVYDPVDDSWETGPTIPLDRQRGSAGVAVYNGEIYIIGGLTNGHTDGWVKIVDKYNPVTNTWTELTDAPRERDHFQAVVVGDKIYCAGGRTTGEGATTFDSLIAEVDVYDIPNNTWSTLPASGNIPTEVAGCLAVNLNGNVVVMGGEQFVTSDASVKVQILNVGTGTWSYGTDMHRARHGAQAIVNNDRIYMAGGSRKQGGSLLTTADANFLMNGDFTGSAPSGTAITKSDLDVEQGTFDFGTIDVGITSSLFDTVITITGDQGIIITDMSFVGSGKDQFSLDTYTLPLILGPGDSLRLEIQFTPAAAATVYSATLEIEHTGGNATIQIPVTGTGGNLPAPIELLDFNVTGLNGNAVINWATASELNNDYFSLEKSENGFSFSSIGTTPGQGNSSEVVEYQFVDDNPLFGKSYYRLKQVDFDGDFSYSTIEEFILDKEVVSLYPNPVRRDEGITIYSNLTKQKDLTIDLIDLTGRKISTSIFTANSGKDQMNLSASNLSMGVYWIQVKSPEGILLQKLVSIL